LEVKFENSSRGRTPVAGLDDVHNVNKIFCNRASRKGTSLVWVDKERDEGTKSKSKAFRVDFEATVFKRDGTEVIRPISANFLGEEECGICGRGPL
jgi:hypothetical protein